MGGVRTQNHWIQTLVDNLCVCSFPKTHTQTRGQACCAPCSWAMSFESTALTVLLQFSEGCLFRPFTPGRCPKAFGPSGRRSMSSSFGLTFILCVWKRQPWLLRRWWASSEHSLEGDDHWVFWNGWHTIPSLKASFLLSVVNTGRGRNTAYRRQCEHKEIYLNNIFKIFQIFIKYFYSVLRSQLKYFSMLYTWLTCAIFRNIKLGIRFWRKKLYKRVYWLLLHIHLRKQ